MTNHPRPLFSIKTKPRHEFEAERLIKLAKRFKAKRKAEKED